VLQPDVLEVNLGIFAEVNNGAKVVKTESLKHLDKFNRTQNVGVFSSDLNDGFSAY
jgi:hypothetical protein